MPNFCRICFVRFIANPLAGLLGAWVASLAGWGCGTLPAADLGTVSQYHVLQIEWRGPLQRPHDTPARDVQLDVTFRHESGQERTVPGFWDGDGRGGREGDVFRVRFCPTLPGRWVVAVVASNRAELRGQRVGDSLQCVAGSHPGFWIAQGRWYRRSDGSWPMIVGNTHYAFLSRHGPDGPRDTDPVQDIRANAEYYKKLRFSLTGDRYPDPRVKPFLDEQGHPSDDGVHASRPNPEWFVHRVDPVVAEAFRVDLICDLILCGPDTQASRSTLQGDPRAWLRYVAARYGSYPHVWFCLCNEWDIKQPRYTAEQIVQAGAYLRGQLAYPTPISVHARPSDWNTHLNAQPWHDHVILQYKLKTLDQAASAVERNFVRGGRKPVVNDENAYEGRGDGFSRDDTVEGCLGTFLGGGYPTTGEKHGNKLGQYFWGGFDPAVHTASGPLRFLRQYVDGHVAFWRMAPTAIEKSIFRGVGDGAALLADQGREYLLGTSRRLAAVDVRLPPGRWRIVQVDLLGQTTRTLSEDAQGAWPLRTPDSRAVLTHLRRLDDPAP